MLMRHHHIHEVKRLKNAAPTDYPGLAVSNGRVTGRATLPIDAAVVADLTE
jgi:hypothetical protein